MPTFLPTNPDPYNSQGVKQAMARRAASNPTAGMNPILLNYGFGGPSNEAANDPALVNARDRMTSGAATAAGIAADKAAAAAPATGTLPVVPKLTAGVDFTHPAPDPAGNIGMHRLAPGIARSSIPGVYAARMKDGSMGFSNVMGANGQPDFGAPDPRIADSVRAANNNVQLSQPAPNFTNRNVEDINGWSDGPVTHGGTYDPYAGQVDPRGMPGMTAKGAGGASVAGQQGYTFANASGNTSAGDIEATINAERANPLALQRSIDALSAAQRGDTNAANSNVASANETALQRLAGARDDAIRMARRNGDTTGTMLGEYAGLDQAGMMGGYGGGGAANGTGAAPARGGVPMGGAIGPFGKVQAQMALDYARAHEQEAKGGAEGAKASQGQQQINNKWIDAQTANTDVQAAAKAAGVPARLYATVQYLQANPELENSPLAFGVKSQLADILRSGVASGGNTPFQQARRMLTGFATSPTEDAVDPARPFQGLQMDGGRLYGMPVVSGPDGNLVPIAPGTAGDRTTERNYAAFSGLPATWAGRAAGTVFGGGSHYSPEVASMLHDSTVGPLLRRYIAEDNAEQPGMPRKGQQ